ncbi:hypothetical protein LIER_16666 [Lithospermum erythrorhizon]|uniref:Reverse transcriptase Ty1/copia-type domain-containing protein n=1 Tax=Lithospermum erythrorhizon TaxID=34254 RepID=A0AAV3QCY3_LITER
MTVATYFGKLEILWDVLDKYSPIHACVCGMSEEFMKQHDEEKFHDFLFGINQERYGNLRSQLLAQYPLPTLDWAYKAMNQEEQLQKRNQVMPSDPTDVMTFAVKAPHKSSAEYKSCFLPNNLHVLGRMDFRSGGVIDPKFEANLALNEEPDVAGELMAESSRGSGRDLPMAEAWGFCTGGGGSSGTTSGISGVSSEQIQQLISLLGTTTTNDCLDGYLINRTPSKVLNFKPPYECLFGVKPSLSEVWVFGSLCYAHNLKSELDKFASRSQKCIFVGYSFGKKGWKVFNMETPDFFVSRDVKFVENVFPFGQVDPISVAPGQPNVINTMQEEFDQEEECLEVPPSRPPSAEIGADPPPSPVQAVSLQTAQPSSGPSLDSVAAKLEADEMKTSRDSDDHLGRGMNTWVPSVRLRDFVMNTVLLLQRSTMKTEIEELENNGTWELAKLSVGKKALGSRWIYKIKYRSDGQIERYKARLVVFGNHQVEGIDYFDMFAPVTKMVTVRTFLAIASAKD